MLIKNFRKKLIESVGGGHSPKYREENFDQLFENAKEKLGISDKSAKAIKQQVYWETGYQKPQTNVGSLADVEVVFVNTNPAIADKNKEPEVPTAKTSDEDTYNYNKNYLKNYDREGKVPRSLQGAIKVVDAIAMANNETGIMEGKENRKGNKFQPEDVRELDNKKVSIIDACPIRSDHPQDIKEYLKDEKKLTESVIDKINASKAKIVVVSGKDAKAMKDKIEKSTNAKVIELKNHISYVDKKTTDDVYKQVKRLNKKIK